MPKTNLTFKRLNNPKEVNKEKLSVNPFYAKILENLSEEFINNDVLISWFDRFFDLSIDKGSSDTVELKKNGKKPLVILGSNAEMQGVRTQVVAGDNSFSVVISDMGSIEELEYDKKTETLTMLDLTPTDKVDNTDYNDAVQYSRVCKDKYNITIIEEVPNFLTPFPEANTFPTTAKIGDTMKEYFREYIERNDVKNNPISTRTSFSFTLADKKASSFKDTNFDLVILDGLFTIRVNNEEYMRTRDLGEVREALEVHPDINSDLNKCKEVKDALNKFLSAYEKVKKTGFVLNGLL